MMSWGCNPRKKSLAPPVIPAQAGIQSVGSVFSVRWEVDSRLRGNDCAWLRPYCTNETTTDGSGNVRHLQCLW